MTAQLCDARSFIFTVMSFWNPNGDISLDQDARISILGNAFKVPSGTTWRKHYWQTPLLKWLAANGCFLIWFLIGWHFSYIQSEAMWENGRSNTAILTDWFHSCIRSSLTEYMVNTNHSRSLLVAPTRSLCSGRDVSIDITSTRQSPNTSIDRPANAASISWSTPPTLTEKLKDSGR